MPFTCVAAYRYASTDPSASASWRWNRARFVCECGRWSRLEIDDHTHRIVRYLQGRRDPALAMARAIFAANGNTRAWLEAHVLADMPAIDIHRRLGLDIAAIDVFERAFYDVRERLSAKAWIYCHAYAPSTRSATAHEEHRLWRKIGYVLGPQGLEWAFAAATGIGREKLSKRDLCDYRLLLQAATLCPIREGKAIIRQYCAMRRQREAQVPRAKPVQETSQAASAMSEKPASKHFERQSVALAASQLRPTTRCARANTRLPARPATSYSLERPA